MEPGAAFDLAAEILDRGGDLKRAEVLLRGCISKVESDDCDRGAVFILDDPLLPAVVSRDCLLCECFLRLAETRKSDPIQQSGLYKSAIRAFPSTVRGHLGLADLQWVHSLGVPARYSSHLDAARDSLRAAIKSNMDGLCERDLRAQKRARSRLALWKFQNSSASEQGLADDTLREDGFTCRLRRGLLAGESDACEKGDRSKDLLCVFDNALPCALFDGVERVFGPESRFWTEHRYKSLHGRYFSYAHRLADAPNTGLDQIVRYIQGIAATAYPEVKNAKFAEWWAHCRPHASGHQMHYDSENEGQGRVRHPIVSCVLYVTGRGVGGPTLVTDQTLEGKSLATRGYLSHPEKNRLVVFKGSLLHGVVPGARCAVSPQGGGCICASARRISFMCAFWEKLTVRPRSDEPGAARPIPDASSKVHTWQNLLKPRKTIETRPMNAMTEKPRRVLPSGGGAVWKSIKMVKGEESATSSIPTLPPIDTCYMGF